MSDDARLQALVEQMRVVIEAVRAVGSHSNWDAPHWNLHVPAREANALFDLAYELDPKLAALLAEARPQEERHDDGRRKGHSKLRGRPLDDNGKIELTKVAEAREEPPPHCDHIWRSPDNDRGYATCSLCGLRAAWWASRPLGDGRPTKEGQP